MARMLEVGLTLNAMEELSQNQKTNFCIAMGALLRSDSWVSRLGASVIITGAVIITEESNFSSSAEICDWKYKSILRS